MSKRSKAMALTTLALFFVSSGTVAAVADDGANLSDSLAAVQNATGVELPTTQDLAFVADNTSDSGESALSVKSPTGSVLTIAVEDDNISDVQRASGTDLTVMQTTADHSYVALSSDQTPGAVYVVMDGPSSRATHRFDVGVDGTPAVLTMIDGGYVSVSSDDGTVHNVIQPAWARDADGRSVATEYTIDGSTLVQTVYLAGGESFPVVADPGVACDWVYCTVELNRAETRNVGYYGGLGGVTAGICALLLPAAGWPAAVCAAAILGMAAWVQGTAADAYDQGKCLGIRALIYVPNATMHPAIYSGGNCY